MRATLVSLFCAALLSVRPAPSPAVRFTDVLSQTGITFRHASGAIDENDLIEMIVAGCGLITYDQDGWLDMCFVNGGPSRKFHHENPLRNALYRNNHDGTFTEVGKKAGI